MDIPTCHADNAHVTQWTIQLKEHHAPQGLAWAKAFAQRYDLSMVSSIRIERGRSKRAVGVYGKCWFPTEAHPKYRLQCIVPGPFPCKIIVRRPPMYMKEDGTFPPTPAGCRKGVRCIDRRTGRQWYRIIGYTPLLDADEAVVWIFAHEMFHYLRRTRQIPGRNNEIQADAYGDAMLEAFRQARGQTGVAPVCKPTPALASSVTRKKKVSKPNAQTGASVATPTRQAEAAQAFSAVAKLGHAIRSWMGLWTQPPAGLDGAKPAPLAPAHGRTKRSRPSSR